MNKLHKLKFTRVLLATVITGVPFVGVTINPSPAHAAAVTVGVSSPASASFSGASAQEVVFGYTTSSTDFANGDEITVTVSPALDAPLSNCSVNDNDDADGDSTTDGSWGGLTTTGGTYTFSAATTQGDADNLCLNFPANSAGSYSIAIADTNDNDFGATLVYIGDDNDVNVTAVVLPTLSFNIRNISDTADTNICEIGQVTTLSQPNGDGTIDAGEGECGYSLAVGTNAASGFTATVEEQGNFTNGSYTIPDQTDDAGFSAGTEGYGLDYVEKGSALTTVSEAGTFATDSSPLLASAANIITSSGPVEYVAGTNANDVTSVIHGLAISTSTPTGNYSHTVTYLVSASF